MCVSQKDRILIGELIPVSLVSFYFSLLFTDLYISFLASELIFHGRSSSGSCSRESSSSLALPARLLSPLLPSPPLVVRSRLAHSMPCFMSMQMSPEHTLYSQRSSTCCECDGASESGYATVVVPEFLPLSRWVAVAGPATASFLKERRRRRQRRRRWW